MSDQDWLLSTIKRIDDTLEAVRANQEKLLIENASWRATTDAALLAVDKRVSGARQEMQREARRWGAAGGAGAGLLAVVGMLAKVFFGH